MSIFLIHSGYSIQIVKLFSSLIFWLRPVYLSYYVKKHYKLNYNILIKNDPLPQRQSGMAQHIAWTVQSSTDIVILTLFSSLENVSVYSVHNVVVQGIKLIITSLTSGLKSFLEI